MDTLITRAEYAYEGLGMEEHPLAGSSGRMIPIESFLTAGIWNDGIDLYFQVPLSERLRHFQPRRRPLRLRLSLRWRPR